MRTWLGHHLRSASLAGRRAAATPVNTLLSLLAIGIALFLPAAGYTLLDAVRQFAATTTSAPQISVFLRIGSAPDGSKGIRVRLEQHPGVRKLAFLPREQTLTRMKANPGLREVIDVLGGNPFPDAFVVSVIDESTAGMEKLAGEFSSWPGIEHVQLDSAWVRRLEAMLAFGRSALLLLASLLGCGLVAISFSIIRMQVLTQRAEVEVSRLLGATEAYIRRPFLYQGVFLGLGGGFVAWLLVAGAGMLLRGPAGELAGLYELTIVVGLPRPAETLGLLASSSALGWLGAMFSLKQTLNAA